MRHSKNIGRRGFLTGAAGNVLGLAADPRGQRAVPEKLVALTFDDAVKSHRTFVAPLLKDLGFGATFFVTHRWMSDSVNFMTWEDIGEIHRMGFEVGNHSWTHAGFNTPRAAARLEGELALVENALEKVGVPRPVSFAYCGNAFGPEAVRVLRDRGYKFARRGMQPEVKYGEIADGPLYDPKRHHPLLIPTTGDAYPGWSLDHFKRVVSCARAGKIVVLQFHGVPDVAHPWVHTPPERFREYMAHLKENGFKVIALRDLSQFVGKRSPPKDPTLSVRHPTVKEPIPLPIEVEATRADLDYWFRNMLRDHLYTESEASHVTGLAAKEVWVKAKELGIREAAQEKRLRGIHVLPYPGGRHPRIAFLEGAVSPLRGTKASVFLPWLSAGYVVVDLPEAIFSNLGLIWLAHTHIPTVWDEQNRWIDNVDWTREEGGGLISRWKLPNGITFGASVRPDGQQVAMELWLRNGTERPLTGLRTQICVMLKGARGFEAQTKDNKRFRENVAAVRSMDGKRWILTAWERAGRTWSNPPCPCIHSDPVLPDCPPGESVRVRGVLAFIDGGEIEREMDRIHDSVLRAA